MSDNEVRKLAARANPLTGPTRSAVTTKASFSSDLGSGPVEITIQRCTAFGPAKPPDRLLVAGLYLQGYRSLTPAEFSALLSHSLEECQKYLPLLVLDLPNLHLFTGEGDIKLIPAKEAPREYFIAAVRQKP